MKLILGDNQFFGINHHDLQKGNQTKLQFSNEIKINDFIKETVNLGMDGFMINSNDIGYRIVKNYKSVGKEEIHYSIPYPHKFATMVNESGMLSLLKYFLSKTSFLLLLRTFPKFLFSRDIKYLIPLIISLEVPNNLKKGSTVYIQNIVTDLILGLKRFDIIEAFGKELRKRKYNIGLITLNPTKLDQLIKESKVLNSSDVIVCFNINNAGFNVFPNKDAVESLLNSAKNYKTMGMSIFASGGGDIEQSIRFIKNLNLDYVVFGSSKINNIKSNLYKFTSN